MASANTILVVEDDPMVRGMLRIILQKSGYAVLEAHDGAQGVVLAEDAMPHLIIMDMGLPVINGWQATNQLRRNTRTQHIPVLALTAYAMPEEQQQSLAAGCSDFLAKPFEFPALLQKIAALLQNTN